MKKNIHPQLYDVTVRCACGNEIQTKSTEKDFVIDICSACHPFFTGQQKFVDTAGRIEKFQKKFANIEASSKPKKSSKKSKK